jgi:nucleotide-binding universal stress UspA family protein
MFKYILVPVTGAETDAPVFTTALAVARLMPAHLEFLHVRFDVQQTLMAIASADMGGGGGGYNQIMDSLEQDAAVRQQHAERAFQDFCHREHVPISSDPATNLPSAEWRMETGDEPRWLAERGHTADLLVVGRARDGEPVAMDVLEAALMASGRPVLIAPAKPPTSLSGTVAIAWKNRPEAARAVAAALPFVEMADRVIILSVDEGTEPEVQSCENLRHALAWHNPNTKVQRMKPAGRPAAETLLAAAGAAGADLLVMGGYGHSRTREVIFGGFTRHVLTGADLPVLMAH